MDMVNLHYLPLRIDQTPRKWPSNCSDVSAEANTLAPTATCHFSPRTNPGWVSYSFSYLWLQFQGTFLAFLGKVCTSRFYGTISIIRILSCKQNNHCNKILHLSLVNILLQVFKQAFVDDYV